ncbi:uncharacterized protein [Coffea arabica]|uniref:KIB1-4 beta-propeller domain-containing protein n=1 Tax=Coffea arabica TaxID=13443 RepID=A0ABM4X7H6_COFAR
MKCRSWTKAEDTCQEERREKAWNPVTEGVIKRKHFSKGTWFIALGVSGEMNLLHPFSRAQIELPHITTFPRYEQCQPIDPLIFIERAILSASPSETSDYVVMAVHSRGRYLGSPDHHPIVAKNPFNIDPNSRMEHPLAGVDYIYWQNHPHPQQISSLGDRSIFVGHNAAFSVDATTSFPGVIRPNCIYFTNDCIDAYREAYDDTGIGGGRDMGIYDLGDSKFECFGGVQSFSHIGPPVWVFPSL